MNKNRVIAIGLEAVEPLLLEKWCEEGKLPTIAALRIKGSYRRMRGPAEVSSGATWSSINCGVTPGKHGMGFCHRQYKTGTYLTRKKRADEVGRLPFWIRLSEAGKQIFTMDVPETRTYGLNGIEIVGWGLEYRAWKTDSTPKEIVHELTKEFGEHPLEKWYQTKATNAEEWKDLSKKILWATETRTKIVKKILSEKKFDFVLVAYAETHFAGHLFWHINDKDHPEYDAQMEKDVGNPILECYQACDRGIKEIMELDPEATFFIFSNTGMGPNYSARHFTGEVLRRLGYRGSKSDNPKKKGILPSADVYAVERFEKMFGNKNIQRVKNIIPEKIWDTVTRMFLSFGSDWKNSIAYDIPGDNTGTVRINLKGREPKGKVDPSEYEALCDKVSEEFIALYNPDTNEKLVTEVIRVREKYVGENGDDLPDLLVKWVEGKPITAMTSPSIGEIRLGHVPDQRTGAHKDFGFFLAVGKGIKHTEHLEEQVYNWDVAPTILYFMGQPIPEDMDGKPMLDILEDTFTQENPVNIDWG